MRDESSKTLLRVTERCAKVRKALDHTSDTPSKEVVELLFHIVRDLVDEVFDQADDIEMVKEDIAKLESDADVLQKRIFGVARDLAKID